MTPNRHSQSILRDRLLVVTTALFGLIAVGCAIVGTIMLFGDWS
jgi:hypothetical protein